MTRPEKVLMHTQRQLEKCEEIYAKRIEVDNFAREHMKPEWHEVKDRDPYSPAPLAIRRFIFEAKKRRHYHDRRQPWIEEMLGEDTLEDKYDAKFRAFPEDIRAQEHVYPDSYAQPTIEDLMRQRSDEDIDAICRPAETNYSRASFA